MRTMLLLACALALAAPAAAAPAPATYDQRQDGEFNVRADVQNVVFVIAYPSKMTLPLLAGLTKSAKPELQERADMRVLEAFVEPSEPYHVELGDAARAAEVVIAGRRRLDGAGAGGPDELKLLGAAEQCGPERERDPVTLACRAAAPPADDHSRLEIEQPPPAPAENPSPEVLPVLS